MRTVAFSAEDDPVAQGGGLGSRLFGRLDGTSKGLAFSVALLLGILLGFVCLWAAGAWVSSAWYVRGLSYVAFVALIVIAALVAASGRPIVVRKRGDAPGDGVRWALEAYGQPAVIILVVAGGWIGLSYYLYSVGTQEPVEKANRSFADWIDKPSPIPTSAPAASVSDDPPPVVSASASSSSRPRVVAPAVSTWNPTLPVSSNDPSGRLRSPILRPPVVGPDADGGR